VHDLSFIKTVRRHHAMTCDINNYRKLSLPARLAISLHCFERYCRAKGLRHPRIEVFLNYMWELPCAPSFVDWDREGYRLADAGFCVTEDMAFSCELIDLLTSAGITEDEFRKLLLSVVEIIHGSAYSASDDAGSLRCLETVLFITAQAGVEPPPIQPFSISAFDENYGWGADLTPDQRDKWRYCAYDDPRA
jgi:hypothetical protein